ncbi:hypothetical protein AbraIFM66951_005022, partial [Aspergillus brasiliensis]
MLQALETDFTLPFEEKELLQNEARQELRKFDSANAAQSSKATKMTKSNSMLFGWMLAQIFPSIGQDRLSSSEVEKTIDWPDNRQANGKSWMWKAREATEGDPPSMDKLPGVLLELWNEADVDSDTDRASPQISSDSSSEGGNRVTQDNEISQQAAVDLPRLRRHTTASAYTATASSSSDSRGTYMLSLPRESQRGHSRSVEPEWTGGPDDTAPEGPEEGDMGLKAPSSDHLKWQPLFPRWPLGQDFPLTPGTMFSHHQYLAALELWKALQLKVMLRPVSVSASSSGGGSLSSETLTDLDQALFATADYRKFIDTSRLTVITYDEEYNGAISLYQVSREQNHNLALRVDLKAYMEEVPRRILRETKKRVSPNRIDILYTNQGIAVRMNGGHSEPKIVDVRDHAGTSWGWTEDNVQRGVRLAAPLEGPCHQGEH